MPIVTHHVRSAHMDILREFGHEANPRRHYQHYIGVDVVNPFHDEVDVEASAATPTGRQKECMQPWCESLTA
jgi:hypothetical protein